MGANSKIQWTDHTFNPWRGCSKVSPGCEKCYAEVMSHRNPGVLGVWGNNGTRVIASESMWREPFKWNREVVKDGVRRRVFCASLADVFEDREELHVPRLMLLNTIRETPFLDWLLLTKRPENIIPALKEALALSVMTDGGEGDGVRSGWLRRWLDVRSIPESVWLGTSVENQEQADKRIPELLKCPAVVRFLSCEPLLGPVDLYRGGFTFLEPLRPPPGNKGGHERGIDWCIIGGESGPNARPCNVHWIRDIVGQCKAAGVAVFVKQYGARPFDGHLTQGGVTVPNWLTLKDKKGGDINEFPADLRVREFPKAVLS